MVDALNGGPGLPRDPFTRVTEAGVGGRPTLVLNAETLAHVALVARRGAEWFRSAGTAEDAGTSLFTISGWVARPGVVEAERGTRLRDVIRPAQPLGESAVLVGGYHGAWVPAGELDVRLTRSALTPYHATVGAGILHVLHRDTCPLAFAADVVAYLAAESARQCGPCLNGLPRMAADLERLAAGAADRSLVTQIRRVSTLAAGRGACAHPDGSARFVASTLEVFNGHVDAHLQGWCPSARQRKEAAS